MPLRQREEVHGAECVVHVNRVRQRVRGKTLSYESIVRSAGMAPALSPKVEVWAGGSMSLLARNDMIEVKGGESFTVAYLPLFSSQPLASGTVDLA